MRKPLLCLIAFFAVLLSSISLFGQETTSEMAGSVSDGKLPLSSATVTAIHLPTGTKYTTTTRKDGRFNLPNVRVGGPYTITISSVGFKNEVQEGIILSLGQVYTFNYSLKTTAQELSSVVVVGTLQSSVFNSGHTGSQEIINRTQLERLPTINRSFSDFTRLEPTANGLNFGGRSSQYNNITVDGANFNNSFGLSGTLGGQTGSQPISLEAVEQIQVNISPYDVRQGGFTGAGVNAVTRSGTNQVKGSAYTYLKSAATQGYRVDNTLVTNTPLSFNIKGFTIGGPIIKNKVFFFVSGEQVRQELPATSYTASDPSHPAVTGSISKADTGSLGTLSRFLQTNFNYDPGAYQGYTFATRSDKITAKIDWNINEKNTFTVKYNYLKSYADQFGSGSRPNNGTSLVNSGAGAGNTGLPYYAGGYGINNNFNILIAELNTRFSNKASNKLQVGYTALRDFRSPHSSSSSMPFVDILDGSNNIYTSFGYEMYTYNNILNTDVYQLSDIFTVYKGAHEITLGTQDYYRKYQNAFAPGYQGIYQFNSLSDFYSSVTNGTANAKNYYLQYSALPGGAFPYANAGSTELGFFAQDKWRINNRFTLTYGLRFDMTIYKQAFTDNPYFDALTFKDGASYNIGQAPGNAALLSPRIGFNYDVLGDKTLQIRGGGGYFSGPPPFVWLSNQASNNGIQFGAIQTSNVAFSADPNKYRPTAGASNTSYSVALTDHNFKYPTVVKTNLGIDKKFGDSWVVTLEGSFSKDINAVYFSNLNLNESNAFALGGVDNRNRYFTGYGSTTSPAVTGTGSTGVVNNMTYQQYQSNKYYYNQASGTNFANYYDQNTLVSPTLGTAILMKNSNKGYAYTLTARVQKTFKNLYTSLAYTYSDSRNVAEGGSTASSLWSARAVSNTDPNGDNLAYSSYYQPHRVIATASYRVEYGKHFATSFGAIFEATSPFATSYIYSNDLNGDGNANDLVYIPRNSSEINLISAGSYNGTTHTGITTGTVADPRTSSQIWNELNSFISQDHYLNFHRGQYAKANADVLPFFKKLDLNITQDIYFYTKNGKEKDKHTLRLSMDLLNAGNFINRNWGLVKTPTLNSNSSGYQLLTFEGIASDGKTPLFSFPYQDATNLAPRTNSYTYNTGITSRWQMQFGIKYLFN